MIRNWGDSGYCYGMLLRDYRYLFVALSTIQCMCSASAHDPHGWSGLGSDLVRRACRDLNRGAQNNNNLSAKNAVMVACAVAKGTFVASKSVADVILPVLMSHLRIASDHASACAVMVTAYQK